MEATQKLSAEAKAALAKRTNEFKLHVALIMRMEGENQKAATFRAYCEGVEGLDRRLGVPPIVGLGVTETDPVPPTPAAAPSARSK